MGDPKRGEEEDVEAHLLKESLGAGLAATAIFAGTSQAGSYPVPGPPGSEDAVAELALIPERGEVTRQVQQAKPKAKAVKAKKAKTKKPEARRVGRGGRTQPT